MELPSFVILLLPLEPASQLQLQELGKKFQFSGSRNWQKKIVKNIPLNITFGPLASFVLIGYLKIYVRPPV